MVSFFTGETQISKMNNTVESFGQIKTTQNPEGSIHIIK